MENEKGRVLLLVGEEIHDVRRVPQANHLLVFGAERELCTHAADPQTLLDRVNEAGGLSFLAHPFERDLPIENEPNYGWHDWNIDGFTGLEIWNYMSSLKNTLADRLERLWPPHYGLAKLLAARIALNPDRHLGGPQPGVLAKWDELLAAGKRIVAIGNSDAHGWSYKIGPLERIIYPYHDCFTAVNTRLLTATPFSGDLAHDKKVVLDALRAGRCWVGYDRPHSAGGFRFTGQGVDRGIMGDEVRLGAGATLQVKAPTACRIRLIHNGTVVAESANSTVLTHIPVDAGAYRAECSLPFHGRERPWIFSNPIYLY